MYLPGKKNRHIPVVIEFGSYLTRAGNEFILFSNYSLGFAGEDLPKTIIPTVKTTTIFIHKKKRIQE